LTIRQFIFEHLQNSLMQIESMEKNAANENEPTTFVPLARATARVVKQLTSNEQQQEPTGHPDSTGSDTGKQAAKSQRPYVDAGLNERTELRRI
jgi:hypothetical protein